MPDAHKRKTILKEVAIALIWPNPENPRSYDDPEAVKELQTNMDAVGQRTPVKMVLLTEDEKAGISLKDGIIGSPTEPIQPNHGPQLGASAQVCPYEYKLLGGHLRRKAAINLGWETLDALILDLTPEEAELEMILDNRISELPWLDQYKIIERQVNKNPGVFQEVIAQRIKVDQSDVSRAMKALKYLNPASRELIYAARIRNGGSLDGGKTVTLAIVALEDPEKVQNTLKVAFDLNLTEAHAKGLVKWVQAGNPPETYTGHKTPKAAKPKAAPPSDEVLAKVAELGRQQGLAEGRGEDPTATQAALNAYLAEVKTSPTPASPHPSHPVTSPEGFALLKQKFGDKAKAVLKPDFKHILHWFKKIPEKVTKKTWRKVFKIEHRFCKTMAKWAVPEHYTHSGGKKASRGFLKDAATLALTLLHWAVYGFIQFAFWWIVLTWLASRFVPFLKPWVEWPFRFAAREVLAIPAGAWAWGSSHEFPAIVIAAVLFVLISMASKVEPMRMTLLGVLVAAVFYYGPRWAEGIPSGTETQASAQVEPTPVPQTALSLGLGQPKHVGDSSSESAEYNRGPRQMASTQGHASQQAAVAASSQMKSWSEEQESKTDLEFEIAAVRANTRIKPFAFEPNYLDGAIAGQRLQDLADPDKYTMRRGHETDKVLGVSLLSTNLIIVYKSSDVFDGIAGGSSKASFYWEDVKTIHVNQLESSSAGGGANTIFQCGVIADGTKEPFTIQCGSEGDLKHLVSALEFWIKTAQGHYAPLTGMPYLNQGLVLNNDCVVDKLWADSPAWNAGSDMEPAQPNRVAQLGASQQVKAGVALGDHLWSIGKVTSERQSRNDLEAGLQSLPITLFAASPAEWEKALTAARAPGQSTGFRPKLRRVVLSL